jgi:hypothetical protein
VPGLFFLRLNSRPVYALPRLIPKRKEGNESFTNGSERLPFTLKDFWCWSTSDLLNNTTRGVLAEFLVAKALEVPTAGVREPWAAYDLITDEGIKIEVKSAAYLQSWAQKRPSTVLFNVRKTRAWDPETNELATDSVRQADVYVFALLSHGRQDSNAKETLDPLDVAHWSFYVLPSSALNSRTRSQQSITLKSLTALSNGPVSFAGLNAAVRVASGDSKT